MLTRNKILLTLFSLQKQDEYITNKQINGLQKKKKGTRNSIIDMFGNGYSKH